MPIVRGIQGGYHVWGAARARYVDPRELRLAFTLTIDGAVDPASIRYDHVDLEGTRDGLSFGEHRGSAIFLPLVEEVRGKPCSLRLEVTDRAARTVVVSRRVRPR